MSSQPIRICITRSARRSYSETFIKDQIGGFSKLAEVFPVHSGRLPERREDGRLLGPRAFWILHKVIRGISGVRNNYFGNYALRTYLQKQRIDVVLANYGIAAAHLVPACRDLGIPLLVIFHGHDATDQKLLKQYRRGYQRLFEYASFVITVSADMREGLIRLGAPPEKIRVVPCGVDIAKFRPASEPKEKLFLAVGRFVEKKGPLHTIKAFHKVWQKHPDAKLVMAGSRSGECYAACSRWVANTGMAGAVVFAGVLTPAEIREWMARARAFVQHSITAANGDQEGTPVSVLEASASGLPVISTFHGGIKEAVVHNKTGFLVKEGDIDGMAASMMTILENSDLAGSMGREGRAHISSHYNQAEQIGALFKLAVAAVKGK